jgi:hypothetical protein
MMAGGAVLGATPPVQEVDGPYGAGGFLARWRTWWGSNQGRQNQRPVPLGPDEAYSVPRTVVAPFGASRYRPLPRYDWGSAGFSYDGGRLTSNPIGAGVLVTHKPPITPSATAQVVNKTSIFWNNQMINNGAQPTVGPLYDPQMLAALLGENTIQAVAPSIPGSAIPYGPLN